MDFKQKCILAVGFLVVFQVPTAWSEDAKLVKVQRIWNKAPHNAFTDLVRFQDRWFCVFREGAGHVSPDGKLLASASRDEI